MTTKRCRARLVPWARPWRLTRKAVARCTGKPEECYDTMGGRVHTAYLDGFKVRWSRAQRGTLISEGEDEFKEWVRRNQAAALKEASSCH